MAGAERPPSGDRLGSGPDRLAARLDVLWPDVGDRLSSETLALIGSCAPEGERRGRLSPAVIEALRRDGYFGLPVPVDMEGGGASLLECCAVQRSLARVDAAAAIGLNMHLFSLGVMVEHWRANRDSSWLLLEAIATQHRMVASGFAEPGLAGSTLRSRCTARPVEGGVIIDGTKTPCSLAGSADLVCFQVQEDIPGGDLLICLVPMSAPGIQVEETWDWLGMRASQSNTVVFEGCEVPDDLIFHRTAPGHDSGEIFAAGLAWFSLTTAAAYVGLVEAALAETVAALVRQSVAHLKVRRSDLDVYQAALGRAGGDLLEVSAAIVAGAAAMDERTAAAGELLPFALATKRRVAQVAVSATDQLAELSGAGALRTDRPMERLVRDVQAARYHPPTPVVTEQVLGRWLLGDDLRIELHDVGGNAPAGPPERSP